MKQTKSSHYLFRKSPLLRTLMWVILAIIFAGISILFSIQVKKRPEITGLTPPVGSPGDLIIITGKDFGNIRDTNYVEFGGTRLTASSYISWKNDEIKVILPPNIQDGLVHVVNKDGKSKPTFFANATTAPVAVTTVIQTSIPIITGVAPDYIYPGSLITITGSNFGDTRDSSKVYFSCNREKLSADENGSDSYEFIAADENNFDYEYWSDSEIRLRVPDGAEAGVVFVETIKGRSANRTIDIDRRAGTKSFISPKTYVIQLTTEIDDNSNDKESTIVLRIPRPFENASQPSAELIECSPEPVIDDFQHTVIHQISGGKTNSGKKRFTENFAVTTFETHTNIVAARLGSMKKVNKNLAENALKADEFIPADNEEVKKLLSTIIKRETNPYNISVLIYNYMIKNYQIQAGIRTGKISALDILDSKKGDAYDFAVLYTTLMRAAGIPTLTDSGILINQDLRTQKHWWCEFYLPNFGWVPCDPALGAGLEYSGWIKDIEPAAFYFGNLDAQHILFSRGWNQLKSSSPNNKTVQKNRSFALQTIWEEASGKQIKYNSFWADPSVVGVY